MITGVKIPDTPEFHTFFIEKTFSLCYNFMEINFTYH